MDNEFFEMAGILCGYLNGFADGTFLPETWRSGAACVSFTGGQEIISSYVNGSYRAGVPFDVRIRLERAADNAAEKLEAAEWFAALAEYVRNTPMSADGWSVTPLSGGICRKSAVFEDGTEEYRAGYLLRFYRKKG